MCMIAYRPVTDTTRGGNIPNSVIDTAISRHSDGFGVAYREKGKLMYQKFGPAHKVEFRKVLKRVDKAGLEYVAHFRWATGGPEDADHAHPYRYENETDGSVLVFHNGVIGIAATKDESDTQVFVRDILTHLPSRWWTNPALVYLVNEAIGYSKLVLMTNEETVNMNEDRGEWDGGIWYSSSHRPTGKWVQTSGGQYGRWDNDTQSFLPAAGATSGKGYGSYSDWDKRRQKSAEESARVLGLTVTDREIAAAGLDTRSEADILFDMRSEYNPACDTSRALVPYVGNVRDVDRFAGLRHGGHNVSDLAGIRSVDGDADYPDGVVCDSCGTMGDAYVISGVVYIEMAHRGEDDAREEESGTAFTQASDLLPL